MPPVFDWAVYLVADESPISGRLAALGCLVERDGLRAFHVRALADQSSAGERDLLLEALKPVVESLAEADALNRSGDAQIRLHLFVYEPAEAKRLARALGRNLDSHEVRQALLQLLRIFPPEETPREPGYRSEHHVPATAVRSVLEALYDLPARVSYDLRTVAEALASAEPPLEEPYRPEPEFARPFSSSLDPGICRGLHEGTLDPTRVEGDVRARLLTVANLARWIAAENARAGLDPFLRLRKAPFRFQQAFDPLHATDLELLEAAEALQENSARLAALAALSEPSERRVQRLRCFAGLSLLSETPSNRPWNAQRLSFRVPAESVATEISPGSFSVILHDDDPDLRLDPLVWEDLYVEIAAVEQDDRGLIVDIEVSRDVADSRVYREMRKRCGMSGYFLDLAHRDVNSPRILKFLRYLASGADE
jgi:hypothetical protein